jgi:hypothetical protein
MLERDPMHHDDALTAALLDIAAEVGIEDALIYLALMTESSRGDHKVRSAIAELRDAGDLAPDRKATISAASDLKRRITRAAKDRL